MSHLLPPETVELIQDTANENIDLVLSNLGIDIDSTRSFGDEIRCVCPLHRDADNSTAFCYNTKYKQWRCYTKKCHEDGFGSVIGLTQKLLSKNQDKNVNFKEAACWLGNLLKIDVDNDYVPSAEQIEINKLLKQTKLKKHINEEPEKQNHKNNKYPFPASLIEGKTEPSWYFLDRGFNADILRKYNVGYCDKPNKSMYLRSYVPVLDENGENVIGSTGRIKYEKCQFCPMFHESGNGCPKDNIRVRGYSKWFHDGFNTNAVLYNLWFAKDKIAKAKSVVLLESPKDVWWLEQHGINNSLAIFGLNILPYHLKKLISLNVTTILLGLDNDKAGQPAATNLESKLKDYFKIINISKNLPDNKDLAQIDSEYMINTLAPTINSFKYE
jgi:hypothetical protein